MKKTSHYCIGWSMSTDNVARFLAKFDRSGHSRVISAFSARGNTFIYREKLIWKIPATFIKAPHLKPEAVLMDKKQKLYNLLIPLKWKEDRMLTQCYACFSTQDHPSNFLFTCYTSGIITHFIKPVRFWFCLCKGFFHGHAYRRSKSWFCKSQNQCLTNTQKKKNPIPVKQC